MTFKEEEKKGKFILIGSSEKKKSQYKVKIQSTPENFLYMSINVRLLPFSFLLLLYRETESKQGDFILNQH
jgi:hypothetical protein